MRRDTHPAPTRRSTSYPPAVLMRVRSRFPCRTISCTTALGLRWTVFPPRASVLPCAIASTASDSPSNATKSFLLTMPLPSAQDELLNLAGNCQAVARPNAGHPQSGREPLYAVAQFRVGAPAAAVR